MLDTVFYRASIGSSRQRVLYCWVVHLSSVVC